MPPVFIELGEWGLSLETVLVFVFALFFYYTGTLEQCWYRRYVFPLLFVVLAVLQWENILAIVLLLTAAALTYYGFKGYGRQLLEEKAK